MIKGIGINCNDEAIDGRLDRLAEDLDRAAAAGFDAYELSLAAVNGIRDGRIDEAELARLAAVLARRPLRTTVHGPMALRLTEPTGRHEQIFRSCLEATARIGADVLVYHSAQLALRPADQDTGPLPDPAALTESWRVETAALQRVARHAEQLGVSVAVENRDPHLWEIAALARHGKSAADLLTYHQGMRLDLLAEQARQVGSPNVGVCLDVGHAFLAAPYWPAGVGGYLAEIRALAPCIRHVHWHDNFGRLDDRCESLGERLIFGEADNHLPPSWGAIPLAAVLAALRAANYGGWLTVELRGRYAHLWPEVAAAARRMVQAVDEN